MKRGLKDLALRAGAALGVPAVFAWRNRRRLPILMYHGVVERPLEPFCWHMLDLARFTRQLEHVAKRYKVLPLDEALVRLRDGTLPPRSCAITFDDGYKNNLTLAYDVLRRLGLPATIFLVTDAVGSPRALWPDRLYLAFARARATEVHFGKAGSRFALDIRGGRARAYAAAVNGLKAQPAAAKDAQLASLIAALDPTDPEAPGPFELLSWDDVWTLNAGGTVTFGAHTTRHEILRHQDDHEVLREVQDSQARVTQAIGHVPRVFAYPNGRAIDFDERAQAAVQAEGIPFALSTVEGLADRSWPLLALPRVCIGADLSFHRFRWLLSGARGASRRPVSP